MSISGLENPKKLWYIAPMAKNQKPESSADDYYQQLAQLTTENREANPWLNEDFSGQLAVDVYQAHDGYTIRAAIAGVAAEDIDISVNDDMVTIRGIRRVDDEVSSTDFLYQECYWGGFSRSIILPTAVDPDHVTANLKNGILRVHLPKIEGPSRASIKVIDEDEPTE